MDGGVGVVLPLPEPVPVPEVGVVLPETGSQPEEGNVVTKFWRIANRPAGIVPLPEIVRSSVALPLVQVSSIVQGLFPDTSVPPDTDPARAEPGRHPIARIPA